MNIEKLAIENQEVPSNEQDEGSPLQTAEITPLPPESYHLVGGGDGIGLVG